MREQYIKFILQFLESLDDDHVKKVYSFTKTLWTLKKEVSD